MNRKYYWVCEHFTSGVGMFKCHAWYTSRWKARRHAFKLNLGIETATQEINGVIHTAKTSGEFYVTERERPLDKSEMV